MAKAIQTVSWQAEEYIERDRNIWWYVGLFVIGIGLCVLSFFLRWWSFIALIVVCIIAILVSSARPPRKINYTLDKDGLTEGGRLHKYDEFRAFGILKEDRHFRLLKRRDMDRVFNEILLYAFAFNVQKLHDKTQQNRLKTMLIIPKAADTA